MSLFLSRYPLLQAPMAGVQDSLLAIAVAKAGGLGALPCAMWGLEKIEAEIKAFRSGVNAPINVNFFCHEMPEEDGLDTWLNELAPYFAEYSLQPTVDLKGLRRPYDENTCELMEKLKPEFVSFHFGLPEDTLLARTKNTGAKVLGTATSLREAEDLESRGCDMIILQGVEAGGHRGMYLEKDIAEQKTSLELIEECRHKILRPLVYAGGVSSRQDYLKALKSGAYAVQVGTAFLLATETLISEVHRASIRQAKSTLLTNLMTGRFARGVPNRVIEELGPISDKVAAFPYAAAALSELKKAAESKGSTAFTALWAGSGVSHCRDLTAKEIFEIIVGESFKGRRY